MDVQARAIYNGDFFPVDIAASVPGAPVSATPAAPQAATRPAQLNHYLQLDNAENSHSNNPHNGTVSSRRNSLISWRSETCVLHSSTTGSPLCQSKHWFQALSHSHVLLDARWNTDVLRFPSCFLSRSLNISFRFVFCLYSV